MVYSLTLENTDKVLLGFVDTIERRLWNFRPLLRFLFGGSEQKYPGGETSPARNISAYMSSQRGILKMTS
jgi:hypothetical protein